VTWPSVVIGLRRSAAWAPGLGTGPAARTLRAAGRPAARGVLDTSRLPAGGL